MIINQFLTNLDNSLDTITKEFKNTLEDLNCKSEILNEANISILQDILLCHFSSHWTFDTIAITEKIKTIKILVLNHLQTITPLQKKQLQLISQYTFGAICFSQQDLLLLKESGFYNIYLVNKNLKQILSQILSHNVPEKIKIRGNIYEAFMPSYAYMNRQLGEELQNQNIGDISLVCDESTSNGLISEKKLENMTEVQKYLFEKGKIVEAADLEIRSLWPIHMQEMTAKYNTFYMAWEESLVPTNIVQMFNENLDFVMTSAESVSKALRDSKCTIPVYTIGQGIEQNNIKIKDDTFNTNNTIRFLNVSSGLPRKGLAELIQAYTKEFTKEDNVKLTLKTFYNDNNNVKELVSQYSHTNTAEIEIIMQDFSPQELNQLYLDSDIYVSPSRGEGFNRPAAEVMYRKIPIIVTGWGGHMDFCNHENAFIVDYSLTVSGSHVGEGDSQWALVDIEDLQKKMRECVNMIRSDSDLLRQKIQKAHDEVKYKCNWKTVVQNFSKYYNEFKQTNSRYKIALLSTWNIKDGIANYSNDLVRNITDKNTELLVLANYEKKLVSQDSHNVIRCWHTGTNIKNQFENILNIIKINHIQAILIQFHFAFFDLQELNHFLLQLKSSNIKIAITFHSTQDVWSDTNMVSIRNLKENADCIDIVYYHNKSDEKNLLQIFSLKQIKHIEHGVTIYPELTSEQKQQARQALGLEQHFLISTHGFLFPHKGVDLLIEALHILKQKNINVTLLSLTAMNSANMQDAQIAYNKCIKLVKKYNLQNEFILITDFLPQEQIYKILSITDLIIFPYRHTPESASGAIRNAIQTNIPVLTSLENIFHDIQPFTRQIADLSPVKIAEEIEQYIKDPNRDQNFAQIRQEYTQKMSWTHISNQTISDIKKLLGKF